jgi:hypothetical protein
VLAVVMPDGGLSPFARLPELRSLSVRAPYDARGRWPTPVVDLAPLSALTELVDLDLQVVEVHDMAPLAALTKLERLAVRLGRGVDPSPILSLGSLRELTLEGEPIREAGRLAALPKLDVLVLGERYGHGSCGNEARYDRAKDGPLVAWLHEAPRRGEDEGCLGDICRIDPLACPAVDSCPERAPEPR